MDILPLNDLARPTKIHLVESDECWRPTFILYESLARARELAIFKEEFGTALIGDATAT